MLWPKGAEDCSAEMLREKPDEDEEDGMSTVDRSTHNRGGGSVIADERLRPLSRDELERYHRNALVPQVGVVGQQRIRPR